MRSSKSETTIAVSKQNHLMLSKLGRKGQSFDDILTEVLKKALRQQSELGLSPFAQVAAESTRTATTNTIEGSVTTSVG